MTPNHIDAIIHKKLCGEDTPKEAQLLAQWLEADETHRAHFRQVEELWNTAEAIDFSMDPGTDEDWKTLSKMIAPEAMAEKQKPKTAIIFRLQAWQKVAAALVTIGLFGLASLYFSGILGGPVLANEYKVPYGTTQTVSLADGTRVTLNAGTILGVYETFDTEQREVVLEGEGFFEVSPDPDRPFIIHGNTTTVRVLGTSFNLSAYASAGEVNLQVAEGKVQFVANDSGAGREVVANEAVIFSKATQDMTTVPYREDAAAWRSGVLVFRNTPFAEVLRMLERYYDVDIENNSSIENKPYTSSFDQLPLDEVLEVLQQTYNFQLERKGDRLRIN